MRFRRRRTRTLRCEAGVRVCFAKAHLRHSCDPVVIFVSIRVHSWFFNAVPGVTRCQRSFDAPHVAAGLFAFIRVHSRFAFFLQGSGGQHLRVPLFVFIRVHSWFAFLSSPSPRWPSSEALTRCNR